MMTIKIAHHFTHFQVLASLILLIGFFVKHRLPLALNDRSAKQALLHAFRMLNLRVNEGPQLMLQLFHIDLLLNLHQIEPDFISLRGLGCSEAFEEVPSSRCHISSVCDSHNVVVHIRLEVVEVRSETISKHSIFEPNHCIGAWFPLVSIITIVPVFIIGASIVFIIHSIYIRLTLQRFPP